MSTESDDIITAAMDRSASEAGGIPAEVREKLNTPLEEIIHDLQSTDTNVKGPALEILSVRLAYELNLTPLRFWQRSRETQGAEVDLIVEGTHLHFSRWLFQYKNTKTVHLSALAKGIGIAALTKAHVIVLVATGRFTSTVTQHADGLAETTPLQVVLLNGDVLKRYYKDGPNFLIQYFRTNAESVMRLKRRQLAGENEGRAAESSAVHGDEIDENNTTAAT